MTARITIASNPRILGALALPVVLVGGSVVIAALVNPLVGIVLAVGLGFLSYRVVRFVMKQLATRISIADDGLTLNLYGEESLQHPWSAITDAGIATEAGGRRTLYAYRADTDDLIMIPDEFADFEQLIATMQENRSLRHVRLQPGQALNERLRRDLGADDEIDG